MQGLGALALHNAVLQWDSHNTMSVQNLEGCPCLSNTCTQLVTCTIQVLYTYGDTYWGCRQAFITNKKTYFYSLSTHKTIISNHRLTLAFHYEMFWGLHKITMNYIVQAITSANKPY